MAIDFKFIKIETINKIADAIRTYLTHDSRKITLNNIPTLVEENFDNNLKPTVEANDYFDVDERYLSGVTKIGNYALNGWYWMKSLTLPKTVISIGDYACANAPNLERVSCGEDCDSLGKGAFQNCKSLSSIYLGLNFHSMGSDAFNGCTSLKEISLLSGTNYIGERAFKDCTSLSDVSIPPHIENISAELFSGCTSLKTKNGGFATEVNSIGERAFKNCTSLEVVEFLSKNIGDEAFSGCTSLRTAKIFRPISGEYVFCGCTSLVDDVIIGNAVEIPNGTFKDCNLSFSKVGSLISIPTQKIGDYAFNNGMGSKDTKRLLTVQYTTTHIGQYAFANCDLDDVLFAGRESSSITIGRGAFANNPDMTGIYLHNLNFVPTIECPVSEILPDSCKIWVHYDKYEEFINAPYWSDEPERIYILESTIPKEGAKNNV